MKRRLFTLEQETILPLLIACGGAVFGGIAGLFIATLFRSFFAFFLVIAISASFGSGVASEFYRPFNDLLIALSRVRRLRRRRARSNGIERGIVAVRYFSLFMAIPGLTIGSFIVAIFLTGLESAASNTQLLDAWRNYFGRACFATGVFVQAVIFATIATLLIEKLFEVPDRRIEQD